MTRRTLVQALATSAVAAPARLKIGVGTYSYHNLSMDAMIAQLNTLGVEEIEMSRGEFMLLSHPKEELFRDARTRLDKAGIRCVSYYTATIRDEAEVDLAVRFAGVLGVRNISGDATGGLLKSIDQRCSAAGLTFGIHNHYFKGEKFPYESPEDVLKALAGLSSTVGATADVGQFASCGHDTVDAITRLGLRLKLVHLKDVAASGGEDNVLLGQGIARIPEVMRVLRRIGFKGLVAVEYEKEGPVERDMKIEIEYARKLA
jgi:sugar phosphate isomerase/epimerase